MSGIFVAGAKPAKKAPSFKVLDNESALPRQKATETRQKQAKKKISYFELSGTKVASLFAG